MAVKIKSDRARIAQRVQNGTQAVKIAVTEAVITYGNEYVRVDQGELMKSALIKSRPKDGQAIWEKGDFTKRLYYTGTPSKDVNSNASLMWAHKGVDTHRKELDLIAQKAMEKGMGK